jgi:hypothetical protein
MCTIFTGFLYVKSLVEFNNVVKGTAVFRTSKDGYDEVIFKKFCGGDDREKNFHVGDIIQVVGRFALEENYKYVCIDWIVILTNMFFQVLITTK